MCLLRQLCAPTHGCRGWHFWGPGHCGTVHQGEQSTHLMFVKIGIWEVQLHKGWKCHRQHSWLSLIQNTVLKADLSQAWAAWHGRHQLQAFLTSQTNGLQGLSLPAHFSRSPLHHPRTAASPWTCTRTLVSFQHHTASCWPEQDFKSVVLKNLLQDLCGTLRELVFWASQHFSHRKLGDESLHFLKDPRCYQSSPLSRALAIYLRLFAILAWVMVSEIK